MAICSFCNARTRSISVKSVTEGWGRTEVQRPEWKESFIVTHCPKHAKAYIEFLYLMGAAATIEEARHLIEKWIGQNKKGRYAKTKRGI